MLFMELTTALLTLAGCSSSATDSNTSEDETNNAATYSQLTSEPSMDGYAVEEPNAGTPKSDIKVSHCEGNAITFGKRFVSVGFYEVIVISDDENYYCLHRRPRLGNRLGGLAWVGL